MLFFYCINIQCRLFVSQLLLYTKHSVIVPIFLIQNYFSNMLIKPDVTLFIYFPAWC